VNDDMDEEVKSEESSRSTIQSNSHELLRDFGGRKLKIPIFRGVDAYKWIVIEESYSKLNTVHEEEKLDTMVITLEDKALNWYQWWEEQSQELKWEEVKFGT